MRKAPIERETPAGDSPRHASPSTSPFGFYWINETHKDSANTQDNSKTESTKQSEERVRPGAIVSNHLSYLDVLYHMSSSFPSFVAKVSQL
ncbi:hypothetical protein Gotri_022479 [Gossypium trilobum]|uniref:Phospholipid/glycerol acyltransferase domain-containing protein n=1 Tax=Gossypium trilobum TaxID=34281 RepID=A0A7J9DGN1_9ROSI|nr:hypothetical protein [Gossypium trilobum]